MEQIEFKNEFRASLALLEEEQSKPNAHEPRRIIRLLAARPGNKAVTAKRVYRFTTE